MYSTAAHRAIPIVLIAVTLGACEKASEKAEREYEMMVRGHASLEQKCAKKKEIAEAYLKERNEKRYWLANIEVRNVCNPITL